MYPCQVIYALIILLLCVHAAIVARANAHCNYATCMHAVAAAVAVQCFSVLAKWRRSAVCSHLSVSFAEMVVSVWCLWCRFIHFPSASAEQAIALGRKAAAVVSARFPAAMELKFEAVCCPFLLLHVNRPAPSGLSLRALSEIKGLPARGHCSASSRPALVSLAPALPSGMSHVQGA